jgi:hypothetical protein
LEYPTEVPRVEGGNCMQSTRTQHRPTIDEIYEAPIEQARPFPERKYDSKRPPR